jgi:hypothetical protein
MVTNFKLGKRWIIAAIVGFIISMYGLQLSTNIEKNIDENGSVYYIQTPIYFFGLFLSLIGICLFTFSFVRYFGKIKEFYKISGKILSIGGIFLVISAFFLTILIYLWSLPPTQRSWFFISPAIIFLCVIGIFHFIIARRAQKLQKNQELQLQDISRTKIWIILSCVFFLVLGFLNLIISLITTTFNIFILFLYDLPPFVIAILLWSLFRNQQISEKINYFFNVVELSFLATGFFFFFPLFGLSSGSTYFGNGNIGFTLIIFIIICLSMIFIKVFYSQSSLMEKNTIKREISSISNQENKIDLVKYVGSIIPKKSENIYDDKKIISNDNNYTQATQKIKQLTSINSHIFLEDIRNLILDGKSDEAYRLVQEREKAYEKFVTLQKDLKDVESKIKTLAQRFAEGQSTSSAFEKARDDLEREKKGIDEQLWTLRSKLFKEDYEKPF